MVALVVLFLFGWFGWLLALFVLFDWLVDLFVFCLCVWLVGCLVGLVVLFVCLVYWLDGLVISVGWLFGCFGLFWLAGY